MRAGLKCFVKQSDLWEGLAVGFVDYRPDENQKMVHVMCSALGQDGPMALGSVPMPNAWEAVVCDA